MNMDGEGPGLCALAAEPTLMPFGRPVPAMDDMADGGALPGRRHHHAVVLLDAAPGHEAGAASRLRRLASVVAVARVRRAGHGLAVLIDTDRSTGTGRPMADELRLIDGVHHVEHVVEPDRPLLRALLAAARWTRPKGAAG